MNRNIETVAALRVSAELGAIQRMFHIRRAAKACFNIKGGIQIYGLKSNFYVKMLSNIYDWRNIQY